MDRQDKVVTGRQIAAARVLLGIGQAELAGNSSISVPTLKRMEASNGPAVGLTNNVEAVRRALEAAGVEFTNGDQPGVRMRLKAQLVDAGANGYARDGGIEFAAKDGANKVMIWMTGDALAVFDRDSRDIDVFDRHRPEIFEAAKRKYRTAKPPVGEPLKILPSDLAGS